MHSYYSQSTLKKVKSHIKKGGVIAYPTEYCYGLGCDPLNRKAVDKIIKLKGRSKTKGLIVIAGKNSELKSLICPISPNEVSKYWPGPYSLILKTMKNVPKNLTGRHEKIAVRITKHELVKQICKYLNSPLVSTSANISGHRPLKNYRDCARTFGVNVMVLPGLTKFARKPSTLIDLESKNILRR